jgi:hypothetical protein
MEGKNKPFKRLVTSYLIYKLMNTKRYTFQKKSRLTVLSKDLSDKLTILDEYKYKNFNNSDTVTYEAMLSVAEEHNLFDGDIYPLYLEVKDLLDKLTFLEPIMTSMSGYGSSSDPLIDVLSDLFKYYKQKLNLDRYKLRLNEDVSESLTEEVVEELTN